MAMEWGHGLSKALGPSPPTIHRLMKEHKQSMKPNPMPIRQDTILGRIRRAYGALLGNSLMCCPCCGEDMTARVTEAELHVDSTGYGVYACTNEECHLQPRYRRSDIEGFWGPTPQQQAQAAAIQAGELEMGRRANEDLNAITRWLRDSQWKWMLDGRHQRLSDVVVAVLESVQAQLAQAQGHSQGEGKR